jgi:hypothetical protein
LIFLSAMRARAADFDDLLLSPESYVNGLPGGPYGPHDFQSGGINFTNTTSYYAPFDWESWSGWAYSNTTDVSKPGVVGGIVVNEASAYIPPNGGGQGGSNNYGVYFQPTPLAPTVSSIKPGTLQGAYFANTTYVALSMLNGDGFAKKFGNLDYDDSGSYVDHPNDVNDGSYPDWLKLTITGLDANDQLLPNPVEFYLADYRNEGGAPDYVIDDWTWVDLSSLGQAAKLQFELTSSDVGSYGMNTPTYFAMDGLVAESVPEPATLVLAALAALVLAALRGKRRTR